jgi:hypothetical protein
MDGNLVASAAVTPSAWANLTFGMTLLAVAGAAALLAAIPIVMARRQRLRAAASVTLVAVFWGIAVAVDAGYGIARTQEDNTRNDQQLRSNYIDPSDLQPPPVWPWVALAGAGVVYAGMLGFVGTRTA